MAGKNDKDGLDPVAVRIGDAIQGAMARLGITNTDLGLAWGGDRQNVQHWLKGKHLPKAADLPRLCELLGIDANELLSVAPREALQGDSLQAHRAWLLDRASAARAKQRREMAPIAPRKKVRRAG